MKGMKKENMKKLATLLLTVAMMLVMTVSTFAATIKVDDVLEGENYSAYKILNYTSSDTDNDGKPDAYSYYLTTVQYDEVATTAEDGTVTYSAKEGGLGALLESVGFKFTRSADGTQYVLNNAADKSLKIGRKNRDEQI